MKKNSRTASSVFSDTAYGELCTGVVSLRSTLGEQPGAQSSRDDRDVLGDRASIIEHEQKGSQKAEYG